MIDKVLNGIPNVGLIRMTSLLAVHHCLEMVKKRLAKHNFKINDSKSQIGLRMVNFLGFQLSADKLRPRPDHLMELHKISIPKNKEELRSVPGTLRHCGQFCKNFSSIAQPMHALLKGDVHWLWTPSHTLCLKTLLRDIPKECILCYNIRKPLFITCGASMRGLGYVLSRDRDRNEILWIGSRVLTYAESSYAVIERWA